MSKTCESQWKRGTKKFNRSDNWRFDNAMSIPSSENEDCHEDRGPKQLDPCDYCRRQPWEGGPGGDTMYQPGTQDHICMYICLSY